MGEPPWWREDEERHRFLIDICYKPLKEVAQRVIERSGLDVGDLTPVKVFDNIDIIAMDKNGHAEKEAWFKRHAYISRSLNKGLMGELWVRNLVKSDVADHERKGSPNGTFYIEDGNHRALVYAVHLELETAVYDPVDAIHSTSWDIANGILGHSMQPASVLEHDGKFPDTRHFKESFDLPVGIQISIFNRSNKF